MNFEKLSMENRVVVVTGAATGMGAAASRLLAARGATVILADVAEAGEATAKAIRDTGAAAEFARLDVSSEDDWRNLVAKTMATHGKIDGLVNNAGVGASQPIEKTSLADYEFMMGVNFKGVFLGCREILPAMKAAGKGSIVNIGSTSALKALFPTGIAIYSASKAAVRMFTKVCAWEYAPYDIRVNAVHPGAIETPMIKQAQRRFSDPRDMRGTTMFDRFGQPEEIAEMVAFLCSEAASYATGGDFAVDGGFSAN